MNAVSLRAPVRTVVGGQTAKELNDRLGVATVEDLLRHYPRRYYERGELTDLSGLRPGELVTLVRGADADAGLADAVAGRVRSARPEVDTVVYEGGQARYPLLIGVE